MTTIYTADNELTKNASIYTANEPEETVELYSAELEYEDGEFALEVYITTTVEDGELQEEAEKLYSTKTDEYVKDLEETEKIKIWFDYDKRDGQANFTLISKADNLDDIKESLWSLEEHVGSIAGGGLAIDEILEGITAGWEIFLEQREEEIKEILEDQRIEYLTIKEASNYTSSESAVFSYYYLTEGNVKTPVSFEDESYKVLDSKSEGFEPLDDETAENPCIYLIIEAKKILKTNFGTLSSGKVNKIIEDFQRIAENITSN